MSYITDLAEQSNQSPTVSGLKPQLVEILRAYAPQWGASDTQQQALQTLSAPEVSFVVTGQQVGLFLSPLLVLYKVSTAIQLAADISEQTATPCLPLFWLQSEDHDLAEIATAVIPPQGTSPAKTLRLEWPDYSLEQNRVPVSEILLPEGINPLLQVLDEMLERTPHYEKLAAALRKSYRPGVSVVDAFATLLASVFEDSPLLFFHPRLPGVAALAAPVFEKSLTHWQEVAAALTQDAERYRSRGAEPPVHVRDDSPLFFLQADDSPQRMRLVRDAEGAGWRGVGLPFSISDQQLETLLVEEPQRFSASALLRPLVQNFLLPTRAYIGGPAEVAYHAQVALVADTLSLPQAPALERVHIQVIESKAGQLLAQLPVSLNELEEGEAALRQRVLNNSAGDLLSPEALRREIDTSLLQLFDRLSAPVQQLDPTLVTPLEKTREKSQQAFAVFLTKYEKAMATRTQVELDRLTRLLSMLAPGGVPQERVFSPLYFLAMHGKPLVARILAETKQTPHRTLEIEI